MAKRVKSTYKEMETLLKAVEKQLGSAAISGGGDRHYKIKVPGKGTVVVSSSPSCRYAHKRARGRLRQMGVDV